MKSECPENSGTFLKVLKTLMSLSIFSLFLSFFSFFTSREFREWYTYLLPNLNLLLLATLSHAIKRSFYILYVLIND